MRKHIKIVIIIITLLLLTSCNIKEGEVKDRVVSPENNLPPINGKWIIEGLSKEANENPADDDYIGKEALFHKDGVVIGGDYSNNPSFKIKNVNAIDYLLYKYKTSAKTLGITDEKIQVVTILNENKYFYEFIKYDKDSMFVNIDEKFYRMKKVTDEVSFEEIERYINVEKSIMRTLGAVEDENLKSGILIGMKIPSYDEKRQAPLWEYKTIWINSQNRRIEGLYELDKLLVPRKNGFWVIDNIRNHIGESTSDELVAIPQFKQDVGVNVLDDSNFTFGTENITLEEKVIPSIIKNILFIGNDYISVENIDLDRNSRKTLQVYTIDNLADKKPISLSDLIGLDGKDIFYEGASSALPLDKSIIPNEENVGLVRKNGYWIMRGRVNYKQNDEELNKDFNIKAIPPKEMVSYDELSIPWEAIRLMVPDVVDVFISPNNEFIVVITQSNLVIYAIEGSDIVNQPVAKIKLPYDAKVIMSEWALGRYANIWQNEVINHNGIKLEY